MGLKIEFIEVEGVVKILKTTTGPDGVVNAIGRKATEEDFIAYPKEHEAFLHPEVAAVDSVVSDHEAEKQALRDDVALITAKNEELATENEELKLQIEAMKSTTPSEEGETTNA